MPTAGGAPAKLAQTTGAAHGPAGTGPAAGALAAARGCALRGCGGCAAAPGGGAVQCAAPAAPRQRVRPRPTTGARPVSGEVPHAGRLTALPAQHWPPRLQQSVPPWAGLSAVHRGSVSLLLPGWLALPAAAAAAPEQCGQQSACAAEDVPALPCQPAALSPCSSSWQALLRQAARALMVVRRPVRAASGVLHPSSAVLSHRDAEGAIHAWQVHAPAGDARQQASLLCEGWLDECASLVSSRAHARPPPLCAAGRRGRHNTHARVRCRRPRPRRWGRVTTSLRWRRPSQSPGSAWSSRTPRAAEQSGWFWTYHLDALEVRTLLALVHMVLAVVSRVYAQSSWLWTHHLDAP